MSRLKRLIQEIHRRSLWQVLGIYLGGRLLMLANRLAPWLVDRSLERTVARARAERGL